MKKELVNYIEEYIQIPKKLMLLSKTKIKTELILQQNLMLVSGI